MNTVCIIIGDMNRLFGFFKDKLTEVKEENQQELQNIVTAL
jgi:hypothetical protein